MSNLTDKEFLDYEGLQTLVDNTKQYVRIEDAKVISEVNVVKQNLATETTRAKSVESDLESKILGESKRAQAEELDIRNNVISVQTSLVEKIDEAVNEHNTELNQEIELRQQADAQLTADYTEKIKALREQHTSDLERLESTVLAEVTAGYEEADRNIREQLNAESAARITADNNLASSINQTNLNLQTAVSALDSKIINHNTQYEQLNQTVTTHVDDKSNPHNVTLEQLTGVTSDTFNKERADVKNTISEIHNTLNTHTTAIESNYSNIAVLQFETTQLKELDATKVSRVGDETITGSLTIKKDNSTATGNLTVEGDLKVKGTTTTVNQETVYVENNLIVVNSDGTNLTSTPAGVAIRTNATDVYGIVYNSTTDSVNLGFGSINESGDFTHNSDQSNAVLTRSDDSLLKNGNMLVWDSLNRRAVDGGSLTTYLEPYAKTVDVANQIATQQQSIDTLTETTRTHTQALADISVVDEEQSVELALQKTQLTEHSTLLMSLTSDKQDKIDESLQTENKTIVGAINKVYEHTLDHSNPHNVTWSQVSGDALSDTLPQINGVATSGQSPLVSRADHVHPTDNTRAPVSHTDANGRYGVASTSEYGHVIFTVPGAAGDGYVLSPVEINNNISQRLATLNYDKYTTTDKTITTLKQIDGKIEAVVEPIQIKSSQVTGLDTFIEDTQAELERLDTTIATAADELSDEILVLENTITENVSALNTAIADTNKTLSSEINRLQTNEQTLDNKFTAITANLKSEVDSQYTEFKPVVDRLDSFSQSLEYLKNEFFVDMMDPSRVYAVTFQPVIEEVDMNTTRVVDYLPVFTTIDDGILEG